MLASRPQDLVAPLTTTGLRQVLLSGSNSDNGFHVLDHNPRRRRQCRRRFQILRATTCATTPRFGIFGARRLGSNGSACRLPSSASRRSLPITAPRVMPPLAAIGSSELQRRRQPADRAAAQQVPRAVVGDPEQSGAEWPVIPQLIQGAPGEAILHHILRLDHVRDFI
jgi:hypothetical protein